MGELLSGSEDRRLLSTFGLLSPGKGIHTVIAAMTAVVARHPDVRYIVAGATHPEQVRTNGEAYRRQLRHAVERAGLCDHVTVADRYLSVGDIAALLRRTHIYLTPYCSREQICSGTLAYALAAGCSVVSTDYLYALDLIPGVAGLVVPPDDPDAPAAAVNTLLDDPSAHTRARAGARRLGAQTAWPTVADQMAVLIHTTLRQPNVTLVR